MLRTFHRAVVDWLGFNAQSAAAGHTSNSPLSQHDLGTAVELFSRLAEITASVGAEVRQHGGNIQSVNDELTVIPQGDVSAVAAVVGKLLVMNQQTQQRLSQAEIRLQAQQRQLADVTVAAKTDALTGLMNRRALDEELRRAIAEFQKQGRPATLLLLDVDHFKRFNDTHGHPAGDLALKLLADVLLAHSRESDVVTRYGGEDFGVVFRGAKAASVCQRGETMRNAIGQSPVAIEHSALRITASSGLTEIQVGADPESLLKRADEALYAAKRQGRNRVVSWQPDIGSTPA
jgi:diguanylate cyclase